jgi:hypothetical protein
MGRDARLGGGRVSLQMQRPIHKVVSWKSELVAAAGSHWPWACQDGDEVAWIVRYGFAVAPIR